MHWSQPIGARHLQVGRLARQIRFLPTRPAANRSPPPKMHDPIFFHTAESTARLSDQFRVLESLEGGWARRLLDETSGKRWVEYYPHPDDRCPKYLHSDPLPLDLHDLMIEALSSPSDEDWAGLAAYVRLTYSAEEIAEELDTLQWIVPSQAIRIFAETYVPEDQRILVGMGLAEIAESYQRFKTACDHIKHFRSHEPV